MKPEYDFLFKVLLVGDFGVGKTELLNTFVEEAITEKYISTIGVDFRIKTITLEGKVIKLQIWDTAGQERFCTISSSYYRGAHGIIVVYDVTDQVSFNNVKEWMEQIEKYSDDSVHKLLIGNKCGTLENKVVDTESASQLAKERDAKFVELDENDCVGIQKAFMDLAVDIFNDKPKEDKQKRVEEKKGKCVIL